MDQSSVDCLEGFPEVRRNTIPGRKEGPSSLSRIARPPPRPPAAAPSNDQHLQMTEAIVVSMKGATAAEKEKKEKFASHKKVKILAACGLYKGEWDIVPLIYEKITEDGRTCSAVQDIMQLK